MMQTDLSLWGMYAGADIVVKVVMLGLLLTSFFTWIVFFWKSFSLFSLKRRLKKEHSQILSVQNFSEAKNLTETFSPESMTKNLINEATDEQERSEGSENVEGIKERVAFRLQQNIAFMTRQIRRGNTWLATVGAISPFVGLFGTLWGIMNSFISIARTQTTSLAVVAPGIAESLLATAMGLVAAIPAVIMYNFFSRKIADLKSLSEAVAAQIFLLQGRDLDKSKP